MLRLQTLENYADSEKISNDIRETFSTVFSIHYADIICKALVENNTQILIGFSDLITKHFSGDISKFSKSAIIQKLKQLYAGPGIEDEIAFIQGFKGFEESKITANEWYSQKKHCLTSLQAQDICDYLADLEKNGRELKAVNFIAMVDVTNKVRGFCIYHVFTQEKQTILHVRQAAMLDKGVGYASTMARYLADRYPHAIYEANQRLANNVPANEQFVNQQLLTITPPVLGYSNKYQGLRSHYALDFILFAHYLNISKPGMVSDSLLENKQQQALSLKSFGNYWEAESISRKYFSAVTFFKDVNQDDCYIDHHPEYVHTSRIRKK